jgi:thiamine phosphate synthase YjbQ (UPF0047 family)
VSSRHTTTALTIIENESRLLGDGRAFLGRGVPTEAESVLLVELGGHRQRTLAVQDCGD